MLKKINALQPIWAKDTDTIANALRNEEARNRPALASRSRFTVKGWNTPVEWVFPSEGDPLFLRHQHRQGHQEPRARRGSI